MEYLYVIYFVLIIIKGHLSSAIGESEHHQQNQFNENHNEKLSNPVKRQLTYQQSPGHAFDDLSFIDQDLSQYSNSFWQKYVNILPTNFYDQLLPNIYQQPSFDPYDINSLLQSQGENLAPIVIKPKVTENTFTEFNKCSLDDVIRIADSFPYSDLVNDQPVKTSPSICENNQQESSEYDKNLLKSVMKIVDYVQKQQDSPPVKQKSKSKKKNKSKVVFPIKDDCEDKILNEITMPLNSEINMNENCNNNFDEEIEIPDQPPSIFSISSPPACDIPSEILNPPEPQIDPLCEVINEVIDNGLSEPMVEVPISEVKGCEEQLIPLTNPEPKSSPPSTNAPKVLIEKLVYVNGRSSSSPSKDVGSQPQLELATGKLYNSIAKILDYIQEQKKQSDQNSLKYSKGGSTGNGNNGAGGERRDGGLLGEVVDTVDDALENVQDILGSLVGSGGNGSPGGQPGGKGVANSGNAGGVLGGNGGLLGEVVDTVDDALENVQDILGSLVGSEGGSTPGGQDGAKCTNGAENSGNAGGAANGNGGLLVEVVDTVDDALENVQDILGSLVGSGGNGSPGGQPGGKGIANSGNAGGVLGGNGGLLGEVVDTVDDAVENVQGILGSLVGSGGSGSPGGQGGGKCGKESNNGGNAGGLLGGNDGGVLGEVVDTVDDALENVQNILGSLLGSSGGGTPGGQADGNCAEEGGNSGNTEGGIGGNGGLLGEVVDTVDDALENVQDILGSLVGSGGGGSSGGQSGGKVPGNSGNAGGVLGGNGGLLGEVVDTVDDALENVQDVLGSLVGSGGGGSSGGQPGGKGVGNSGNAGGVLDGNGGLLGEVVDTVDDALENVQDILGSLVGSGGGGSSGGQPGGKGVGNSGNAGGVLGGNGGLLGEVVDTVDDALENVQDILGSLVGSGGDENGIADNGNVGGLVGGTGGLLGEVVDTVDNALENVQDILGELVGSTSSGEPGGSVPGGIGGLTGGVGGAAGMSGGITGGVEGSAGGAGGLAGGVGGAAGISGGVTGGVEGSAGGAGGLTGGIGGSAGISGGITGGIEGSAGGAGGLTGGVGGSAGITGGITGGVGGSVGGLGGLTGGVGGIAGGVGGLTGGVGGLTGGVGGLTGGIGGLTGGAGGLTGGLGGVTGGVGGIAGGVGGLTGGIGGLTGGVGGLTGGIGGLTGGAGSLTGGLGGLTGGAGGLTGGVGGIAGGVGGIAGGVGGLTGGVGGLTGGVGGLTGGIGGLTGGAGGLTGGLGGLTGGGGVVNTVGNLVDSGTPVDNLVGSASSSVLIFARPVTAYIPFHFHQLQDDMMTSASSPISTIAEPPPFGLENAEGQIPEVLPESSILPSETSSIQGLGDAGGLSSIDNSSPFSSLTDFFEVSGPSKVQNTVDDLKGTPSLELLTDLHEDGPIEEINDSPELLPDGNTTECLPTEDSAIPPLEPAEAQIPPDVNCTQETEKPVIADVTENPDEDLPISQFEGTDILHEHEIPEDQAIPKIEYIEYFRNHEIIDAPVIPETPENENRFVPACPADFPNPEVPAYPYWFMHDSPENSHNHETSEIFEKQHNSDAGHFDIPTSEMPKDAPLDDHIPEPETVGNYRNPDIPAHSETPDATVDSYMPRPELGDFENTEVPVDFPLEEVTKDSPNEETPIPPEPLHEMPLDPHTGEIPADDPIAPMFDDLSVDSIIPPTPIEPPTAAEMVNPENIQQQLPPFDEVPGKLTHELSPAESRIYSKKVPYSDKNWIHNKETKKESQECIKNFLKTFSKEPKFLRGHEKVDSEESGEIVDADLSAEYFESDEEGSSEGNDSAIDENEPKENSKAKLRFGVFKTAKSETVSRVDVANQKPSSALIDSNNKSAQTPGSTVATISQMEPPLPDPIATVEGTNNSQVKSPETPTTIPTKLEVGSDGSSLTSSSDQTNLDLDAESSSLTSPYFAQTLPGYIFGNHVPVSVAVQPCNAVPTSCPKFEIPPCIDYTPPIQAPVMFNSPVCPIGKQESFAEQSTHNHQIVEPECVSPVEHFSECGQEFSDITEIFQDMINDEITAALKDEPCHQASEIIHSPVTGDRAQESGIIVSNGGVVNGQDYECSSDNRIYGPSVSQDAMIGQILKNEDQQYQRSKAALFKDVGSSNSINSHVIEYIPNEQIVQSSALHIAPQSVANYRSDCHSGLKSFASECQFGEPIKHNEDHLYEEKAYIPYSETQSIGQADNVYTSRTKKSQGHQHFTHESGILHPVELISSSPSEVSNKYIEPTDEHPYYVENLPQNQIVEKLEDQQEAYVPHQKQEVVVNNYYPQTSHDYSSVPQPPVEYVYDQKSDQHYTEKMVTSQDQDTCEQNDATGDYNRHNHQPVVLQQTDQPALISSRYGGNIVGQLDNQQSPPEESFVYGQVGEGMQYNQHENQPIVLPQPPFGPGSEVVRYDQDENQPILLPPSSYSQDSEVVQYDHHNDQQVPTSRGQKSEAVQYIQHDHQPIVVEPHSYHNGGEAIQYDQHENQPMVLASPSYSQDSEVVQYDQQVILPPTSRGQKSEAVQYIQHDHQPIVVAPHSYHNGGEAIQYDQHENQPMVLAPPSYNQGSEEVQYDHHEDQQVILPHTSHGVTEPAMQFVHYESQPIVVDQSTYDNDGEAVQYGNENPPIVLRPHLQNHGKELIQYDQYEHPQTVLAPTYNQHIETEPQNQPIVLAPSQYGENGVVQQYNQHEYHQVVFPPTPLLKPGEAVQYVQPQDQPLMLPTHAYSQAGQTVEYHQDEDHPVISPHGNVGHYNHPVAMEPMYAAGSEISETIVSKEEPKQYTKLPLPFLALPNQKSNNSEVEVKLPAKALLEAFMAGFSHRHFLSNIAKKYPDDDRTTSPTPAAIELQSNSKTKLDFANIESNELRRDRRDLPLFIKKYSSKVGPSHVIFRRDTDDDKIIYYEADSTGSDEISEQEEDIEGPSETPYVDVTGTKYIKNYGCRDCSDVETETVNIEPILERAGDGSTIEAVVPDPDNVEPTVVGEWVENSKECKEYYEDKYKTFVENPPDFIENLEE